MGILLNPDNLKFREAINSEIYIDKTELIKHTNKVLQTKQKYICVSRPRRFGKSMAADMLTAYYSRGCDSEQMFSKYKISGAESFGEHLNKYNVIHINMVEFLSYGKDINEILEYLVMRILRELKKEYHDVDCFDWNNLVFCLEEIFYEKKKAFVFIIDEWDCIFRKHKRDKESQTVYLDFLRNLLKDRSYVALAYMTGILPIKKYGEHSAINMFTEISMINASPLEEFTGFTEDEVNSLCMDYQKDYNKMKNWYDGYEIGKYSIYNPKSVVESIVRNSFRNYWTSTETYEALKDYIRLDFDGLREKVTSMIAGEKVRINTAKFQNDMTTLNSADDVLTLLVHLGYLTYGEINSMGTGEVWIPNGEVRQEFINSIEDGGWEHLMRSINASEELLKATLDMDNEKVAQMIENCHNDNASIFRYNDENSLACVITIAYYYARNKYIMHREYATGKGYADIVFIPLPQQTELPAIVVELKYNHAVETAINQIKDKKYTEKLQDYTGEILLAGISYDETKGHSCEIERFQKL